MTNIQFAGSASLAINGITPLMGPKESVAVAVNYSSGVVNADDYLPETYTVNAGTVATVVNLGKIITGQVLWVQTNNPIVVTLTQDFGAGPVTNDILVSSFLFLPAVFTVVSLANPGGTAANVAVAIAGARAPVGAGAGIF